MNDPETVTIESLERTRRSLHAIAELVMAGPQFDRSQSIELRVCDGGFTTSRDPDLRMDGDTLVAGGRRISLHGRSVAEVAADAGVSVRPLRDVYAVGPDLGPDDRLDLDEAAARQIARAFALGDRAMQAVAPDRPRVLWPEHFDVGMDRAEVNYGVSPGDGFCPEPYAYVGPWSFSERAATDAEDAAFWNAPFGASRTIRELDDEAGVQAFFEEGMRRA